VTIGSFCSIADGVRIFVGGNHRTDWISTFPLRIVFDLPGRGEDGCVSSKGDVVIGHDVWIGAGVTVLSGVHIGNGAVLGASAVVTSDVAAYTIVVGNPARKVRDRFSPEHIARLEAIRWWEWPVDRIIASVPTLCSPRVTEFCSGESDEEPRR
jgi:acetyltransferase-like isoleucine patch superfamily enzyme